MAKQTKPTPGPQEGLPSPQQAALAGGPDAGWRKTAVVLAGILALCYAVHPSIAAVSATEFYYGDRLDEGVIVVKYGHGGEALRKTRVIEAGRPV